MNTSTSNSPLKVSKISQISRSAHLSRLYLPVKILYCFSIEWNRIFNFLSFVSANFEESVVEKLPVEFNCGIYCGWASVNNGPVYKMVMSIGFNPFYSNTKKTMVSNDNIEHRYIVTNNFYVKIHRC